VEIADHVRIGGTTLPRHAHDEWHLVVVLEGAFEESSGGRTRHYAASAVILRAPGEEHRDVFRAPRTRYASVALTADPSLPRATRVSATPLTPRLARELRSNGSAATGLMMQILGDAIAAERTIDPRVRIARELIEDRFGEHLRVRDLAGETGLHPASLARGFRATYGCNPGEFLLFTRVRHALSAIAAGRETLAEIALRCGFYDQSHFSNAFRRVTGMPPKAYAKTSLPSKL